MKNGTVLKDNKGRFSKTKVSMVLLGGAAFLKLVADYITTGTIDINLLTTFFGTMGIYGVRDAIKN